MGRSKSPDWPIFFPCESLKMGTCAIFIDGGYLEKVLVHNHPGKFIDFEKLANKLAGSDTLLRAHYYHCLPYQSSSPTPDEATRYSKKHKFFTKLGYLPRFDVKLGRLIYAGNDSDGNPVFIQKRVDVMLGVDMVLLASKAKITDAILISGDSDLIPAIEVVKSEGVVFTLWHGLFAVKETRPSRELHQMADERNELDESFINTILLTPPV